MILEKWYKPNRKTVGICKKTIEMVEIRANRRVESSGTKRVKKID